MGYNNKTLIIKSQKTKLNKTIKKYFKTCLLSKITNV